jgi:uncharacterized protein YutE (UPF0331/DUF86 family)
MSLLADRLAELRRHLDHLEALRPRIGGVSDLERDLSLHNDVLFSLLMTCQAVIDVAAELAARRSSRYEDYRGAIRALAADSRFPEELVRELERLPGFRNVLIHDYAALDLARVIEALDRLSPVRKFVEIVARSESS